MKADCIVFAAADAATTDAPPTAHTYINTNKQMDVYSSVQKLLTMVCLMLMPKDKLHTYILLYVCMNMYMYVCALSAKLRRKGGGGWLRR